MSWQKLMEFVHDWLKIVNKTSVHFLDVFVHDYVVYAQLDYRGLNTHHNNHINTEIQTQTQKTEYRIKKKVNQKHVCILPSRDHKTAKQSQDKASNTLGMM